MELKFHVPEAEGDVSALVSIPHDVRFVYVLGHGAGAGMRHHFMERMSELLVARGVGTFRYQFPYMESGKKRPDMHRVLHGTVRAEHLQDVAVPMLFLQGTRDSLAEVALVKRVAEGLGLRATMHIIEGGDHSFKVPKRSGRTEDEVFDELADTIDDWVSGLA